MANKEQWVNLPKDSKFEESGVTLDRLGPITMELGFKKSKPPKPWKVKVTPEGSDNASYSRKERGRNSRFKLLNYVSFGIADDSDVLLENTVRLPAAGGDKFKIEAQDSSGKAVGSPLIVETRRKLYYQVVCMKGIGAMPTGDMESAFWNPSKSSYLKLKAPKPVGTMKYHKNIKDDWNGKAGRKDMFREAKKGYKLKDLHPFTFVVVCSNQNASATDIAFKFPYKMWGKLFSKKEEEVEVPLPRGYYLWYDFDDIDDAKRGGKGIWLRHRVVFDDGKAAQIQLDWANAELGPANRKFYTKIKVKIPRDVRNVITTRKGHLILKVKVVEGFSCGYSDPMANFITVCQQGWHKKYGNTERSQTLIHEVGHKVGMVPDGKGIAPNAPPNLYGNIRSGAGENNKGHQGPHCEKGATYNATKKKWTGQPGCVMFGADATSDGKTASGTFCGDCGKALRKVDMDARELSNFKKFVTDY